MRSLDDDSRGLVNPTEARRRLAIDRVSVTAGLAWAVDYHWSVVWELDEPYEQRIVPAPAVHLTFEPDGAFVTGVATGEWSRRLENRGSVLGVKFRPAGFRPFLGCSLRSITDQVVPLVELLGDGARDLERAAAPFVRAGRPHEIVPLVEEWLEGRSDDVTPAARRDAELVSVIVEEIVADPGVVRVAALADQLGVTTRQLQRVFAGHVGVNPKWVIDRARVHEIGERVRRGDDLRWADLAVELGYADQAHLIRRFTEAVGEPPARYASKVAADR